MSIFKTDSPETSTPPELRQSAAMDYAMPMMTGAMSQPSGNVKVAQSFDEAEQLLRSACCGDQGARSIEHVARPRYGRKV